MGSDGFEPPKAKPAELQSAPFGHSGNCPCSKNVCLSLAGANIGLFVYIAIVVIDFLSENREVFTQMKLFISLFENYESVSREIK